MAEPSGGPAPRPGPWRSVRVRITVVSVLVFTLAFGVAAFALVVSVRRALVAQVSDRQRGTELQVTQRLEQGQGVPNDLPGGGGMLCSIDPSPGGEVRQCVATLPNPGVAGTGPGPAMDPDDVLVSEFDVRTADGIQTLRLVTPLAGVRTSVDALTRVLVIGTPVLVALFGAIVWWLVGRALRPVERLRAEVDAISHSTLDRRLRPPGSHDEIDRLARTMNDMLDRLQRAAVEQQRFVSDASHELRTPLSVIRTALDVRRVHPDSLAADDALARIDRATTRTEELVDELLELARIDEPGAARPAETVRLDEVVAAAVRDLGESRVPVTVTTAGVGAPVTGDPALLRRLVDNLVGNAVTHARGQVAVGVEGARDGVVLTVDDDGPGVPPPDRAAVFERFTRLDDARTGGRGSGGWGLGLAIAAAVVRRHGGSIAVGDAPSGGARFLVRLPMAGTGTNGMTACP